MSLLQPHRKLLHITTIVPHCGPRFAALITGCLEPHSSPTVSFGFPPPISQADGVALTYGNARMAVEATSSAAVLVDRSHWPRIRVTGRDRVPLLQRCSTQDFSNLTTGQGCDTVRTFSCTFRSSIIEKNGLEFPQGSSQPSLIAQLHYC